MSFTDAELDALAADYAEATRPIRATFVAAIDDEQQRRGPYRARVMLAVPRLIAEVRDLRDREQRLIAIIEDFGRSLCAHGQACDVCARRED